MQIIHSSDAVSLTGTASAETAEHAFEYESRTESAASFSTLAVGMSTSSASAVMANGPYPRERDFCHITKNPAPTPVAHTASGTQIANRSVPSGMPPPARESDGPSSPSSPGQGLHARMSWSRTAVGAGCGGASDLLGRNVGIRVGCGNDTRSVGRSDDGAWCGARVGTAVGACAGGGTGAGVGAYVGTGAGALVVGALVGAGTHDPRSDELTVPSAHGAHSPAPAAACSPSAHAAHELAPAPAARPGSHAVHVLAPADE